MTSGFLRHTLALPLFVAGLGVSASSALAGSAVETILAPHKTAEALSAFIFAKPSRCIELTQESRACLWQIGNRRASWESLAKTLGTIDRINVICTLPTTGDRAEDSCAGYPQRSNRGHYRVAARRATKGRRADAETLDQKRRQMTERGRAALRAARNLDALVALTGTLPTHCAGDVDADRTCVWRLSARTLGHGTVAASAELSPNEQVRLECPIDAMNARRGECRAREW